MRAGTPEFSTALETYLMHELTAYSDYRSGESLHFWRTTSGFEADFILGDHTAIEVKAPATVSSNDLKGLVALAEERKLKRYVCVLLEPRRRTVGNIVVLLWRAFRDNLWGGDYAE